MNLKKFAFFCLLICILTINIYAQDEDYEVYDYMYDLGDQIFIIRAGLFIPLFYLSSDFDSYSTNLSIGGVGSLEWSAFINNRITLGGELSGMFAFSPNDRVLYMIPITFKAAYYFRKYPFEFPIFCGAGISLNTIGDSFHADFILKPGASAIWNFNHEWAFGFNAVYWWIPQVYSGNGKVPSSHTMFGNFLETTLSAMFRF
ncbi:MAG: hypothetical protein FWE72_01825 [Spirochaetaceae bacterium]|nr:hypothetical protein [Spirochaetaceae bacterium]